MAIELTRFAGRSTASLTSATMTGVIAVAHTVPACHSLETTVAATTEATAAATSVLDVETAAARAASRAGERRSGVAERPSDACWAVTTSCCDCARGGGEGAARHREWHRRASPLF